MTTTATENLLLTAPEVAIEAGGEPKRPRISIVAYSGGVMRVPGWGDVAIDLDGNGRLGRLLITLILCAEGALAQPLLYISLFFKQHRQEYYDRLDAVRLKGDWLGWLRFFLEGVEQTAQQAADTAGNILKLFDEDRAKVENLGRKAGSAHRLLELLRRHPITTIPNATGQLSLSAPTVRKAMEALADLGIVREITGKQRDRIYIYDRYVSILDEGTQPLS